MLYQQRNLIGLHQHLQQPLPCTTLYNATRTASSTTFRKMEHGHNVDSGLAVSSIDRERLDKPGTLAASSSLKQPLIPCHDQCNTCSMYACRSSSCCSLPKDNQTTHQTDIVCEALCLNQY